MGQPHDQPESEQRSFTGANQGGGDRTEIGLAKEMTEGRQRRLGSQRSLSDGVHSDANEKPIRPASAPAPPARTPRSFAGPASRWRPRGAASPPSAREVATV